MKKWSQILIYLTISVHLITIESIKTIQLFLIVKLITLSLTPLLSLGQVIIIVILGLKQITLSVLKLATL
jgi:hypothetical protein